MFLSCFFAWGAARRCVWAPAVPPPYSSPSLFLHTPSPPPLPPSFFQPNYALCVCVCVSLSAWARMCAVCARDRCFPLSCVVCRERRATCAHFFPPSIPLALSFLQVSAPFRPSLSLSLSRRAWRARTRTPAPYPLAAHSARASRPSPLSQHATHNNNNTNKQTKNHGVRVRRRVHAVEGGRTPAVRLAVLPVPGVALAVVSVRSGIREWGVGSRSVEGAGERERGVAASGAGGGCACAHRRTAP